MPQRKRSANTLDRRWKLFFRLSKYSDTIKEKLMSGEVKITPEFRQNEMIAMIGDGLEDVSFSRTKTTPGESLSQMIRNTSCTSGVMLSQIIFLVSQPAISKKISKTGTVNSMSSARILLVSTVSHGLACSSRLASTSQKHSRSRFCKW